MYVNDTNVLLCLVRLRHPAGCSLFFKGLIIAPTQRPETDFFFGALHEEEMAPSLAANANLFDVLCCVYGSGAGLKCGSALATNLSHINRGAIILPSGAGPVASVYSYTME